VPDLLINSAGVAQPGYVQENKLDTFRWMMDVNYYGTLHVTKALLPTMIERRSGYIVNISPVAGFLGVFGYTAWTCSLPRLSAPTATSSYKIILFLLKASLHNPSCLNYWGPRKVHTRNGSSWISSRNALNIRRQKRQFRQAFILISSR
jgi:NAD(P)-dependent dehydrogenase (short-subunit alcohol dehydrogenase family)